jgi:hypothetical protein
VFQPSLWATAKDKKGIKSTYFWYHLAVTTSVLAVLLCDISLWPVLLCISAGHLLIDAIKPLFSKTKVWIFIADQMAHLLLITLVWLCYTSQLNTFWIQLSDAMTMPYNLWLLFCYLVLATPSSVAIGKMTHIWDSELEKADNEPDNKGLTNAGKWIGILERLLIFTFIVINEFSAIGFLLAAKSVFRFGDLKNSSEHKKTEYIIIGTFISFSFAIAAGLFYKYIIT